ncbi:MAG TPA: LysR family transcriptional regulator [Puia sp.]|nr:LysR family transcriptional regulator [Puia sp.]
MNTNDLKIFEAVARHGSFTRAAESVFTVQSNVTARIKSLEEEFGAPLFSRSPRKVELTGAGRTLMKYYKRLDHLLEEAKNEMKNTGTVAGSLKIGCIETTMALKGPDILLKFSATYPDVELEFVSAMRGSLVGDLLGHRLDAAFIPGPIHDAGLDQLPMQQTRLVLLGPATAKTTADLLKRTSDPLKREPPTIIVFEQGCVYRNRLEAWLSSKGVVKYKRIVLNSIEGIVNFVESDIGMSILPLEVITKYYPHRKLKTFALNKELGTLTNSLAFRKGEPPSRALEAFLEMHR